MSRIDTPISRPIPNQGQPIDVGEQPRIADAPWATRLDDRTFDALDLAGVTRFSDMEIRQSKSSVHTGFLSFRSSVQDFFSSLGQGLKSAFSSLASLLKG